MKTTTKESKALHTLGEWFVKGRGAMNDPFWIESTLSPNVPIAEIMMPYGKHISELKANAELIASAPRLKEENEKLKEDSRKAKMQIADLIEALTPFSDMTNEFTGIKLRQGGEVFQYNDKKLMTSDFVKALDLIQYLSHHQIK